MNGEKPEEYMPNIHRGTRTPEDLEYEKKRDLGPPIGEQGIYYVECLDPDCGWAGLSIDCFIPKNHPECLICPDCGKEVEPSDTY